MTLRVIKMVPAACLRAKSLPVETVNDQIKALADDMLETMYHAPGIGLAANQIGVMKRLFVLDIANRDVGLFEPRVFINPEITWFSKEIKTSLEGCLSIPSIEEDIERSAKIHVSFLNKEGEQEELEAEGKLAVCIQHEVDHLNGILFIDYLGALKRNKILNDVYQNIK